MRRRLRLKGKRLMRRGPRRRRLRWRLFSEDEELRTGDMAAGFETSSYIPRRLDAQDTTEM